MPSSTCAFLQQGTCNNIFIARRYLSSALICTSGEILAQVLWEIIGKGGFIMAMDKQLIRFLKATHKMNGLGKL